MGGYDDIMKVMFLESPYLLEIHTIWDLCQNKSLAWGKGCERRGNKPGCELITAELGDEYTKLFMLSSLLLCIFRTFTIKFFYKKKEVGPYESFYDPTQKPPGAVPAECL